MSALFIAKIVRLIEDNQISSNLLAVSHGIKDLVPVNLCGANN